MSAVKGKWILSEEEEMSNKKMAACLFLGT
jgi:hypothetical protein